MQGSLVHVWSIVGLIVATASVHGGTARAEPAAGEPTMSNSSYTVTAGSVCSPSGKVSPVISREIGWGEMGKHRIYDWYDFGWGPECTWFEDTCDTGLYPMNVDTQSNPLYEKALTGNFSCWWNNPDVICWQHPLINYYIYVRDCYVRPDGSRVDYGCGCW